VNPTAKRPWHVVITETLAGIEQPVSSTYTKPKADLVDADWVRRQIGEREHCRSIFSVEDYYDEDNLLAGEWLVLWIGDSCTTSLRGEWLISRDDADAWFERGERGLASLVDACRRTPNEIEDPQ